MKKFYIYSTALSLALLGGLHADALPRGICEPGCYPDAYNPILGEGCCGISGHLDYLYLKGNNQLELIALNYYPPNTTSNNEMSSLSTKTLDYDYTSGFRVGLNYLLPCNAWKLDFSWMHYDQTADMHYATSRDGDTQVGTTITPLLVGARFSGNKSLYDYKAHGHISFNELNLTFSNDFLPGKSVIVSPFGGLRALFISQKINSNFIIDEPDQTTPQTKLQDFDWKSQFKGVGINTGLAASWIIGCGLSIYTKGGVSLIYGEFDIDESEESQVLTTNLSPARADLSFYRHPTKLLYALDADIGIKWIVPFACDQGHFTAELGWMQKLVSDQNTLFGYNGFISTEFNGLNQSNASLSLNGLRFGIGIAY